MPAGFQYQDNFITSDDEVRLADEIASIEFSTFEMRGVVARRRVAFFGRSYDAAAASTPPLPAFLMPLRDKVARWANVDAQAFAMALINEYVPAHRSAGIAMRRNTGLSLASPCSPPAV